MRMPMWTARHPQGRAVTNQDTRVPGSHLPPWLPVVTVVAADVLTDEQLIKIIFKLRGGNTDIPLQSRHEQPH